MSSTMRRCSASCSGRAAAASAVCWAGLATHKHVRHPAAVTLRCEECPAAHSHCCGTPAHRCAATACASWVWLSRTASAGSMQRQTMQPSASGVRTGTVGPSGGQLQLAATPAHSRAGGGAPAPPAASRRCRPSAWAGTQRQARQPSTSSTTCRTKPGAEWQSQGAAGTQGRAALCVPARMGMSAATAVAPRPTRHSSTSAASASCRAQGSLKAMRAARSRKPIFVPEWGKSGMRPDRVGEKTKKKTAKKEKIEKENVLAAASPPGGDADGRCGILETTVGGCRSGGMRRRRSLHAASSPLFLLSFFHSVPCALACASMESRLGQQDDRRKSWGARGAGSLGPTDQVWEKEKRPRVSFMI